MTALAHRLFALPPFPRSRPHAPVRHAPGTSAAGSAAELIDAWRTCRLVPGFWREPQTPGDAAFVARLCASPGGPAQEDALQSEVERALLRDLSYHDPFTGRPIAPAALIAMLAGWQTLIAANRPIAAAFGIAQWKRDTVEPLIWGGHPVPFRPARIADLNALPEDALVAIWKARVPDMFLARLESGPWRVLEIEDGFIRSVGLGADCIPPLSIVVDDLGIHYDHHRPSRLEEMLAGQQVSPVDLERARLLRARLVREGVSKYGLGAVSALPRPGGGEKRHILVVGQVEDDRSVRFGAVDVRTNLDLLRRARALEPDAYLVYRPHPDVEAGHRRGAIPHDAALELADSIDATSPISALIGMADAVHVITSLAGFEALLQGRAVTTHGVPFFAGWGLTHDLAAIPARRGVVRQVDELIAATLLQYPRYLDPMTNLPCTAEVLVSQLLSGATRQNGALVWARRLQGKLTGLVRYFAGYAMKHDPIARRNFLFLQGPPGPFFWQLAEELRTHDCGIHRINLNWGDKADWPGAGIDYRGTRRKWTLFIDRFLSEHAITDLVLFGDCRPLHLAAHRMAQLRKIEVHVFEEGYIRPDWLTLEPSGVNGNSSLSRDPSWFLREAQMLPPLPVRPTITASFKRRARDAFNYYSYVFLGMPLFPFYRSHRQSSIISEAFGWTRKYLLRGLTARRCAQGLESLSRRPYFLFPMQLSNDFQIREHSPFQNMAEAVDYVLYSFARRAPSDVMLVTKEHPLDASFSDWHNLVRRRARRLGIADRVLHIAGGDLDQLARDCRGVVTVNSTSATISLAAGVPTAALGKAIYNMPGITHQGRLDDFWMRPQAPDPAVYDAFRRVLYDRCLIYGGLASESATQTLVASAIERLVGDTAGHWRSAPAVPSIPVFARASGRPG